MWQYRNTDELYHSKYLRKYIGKSGKMVYVYPRPTVKKTNTQLKNGVYQKSTDVSIGKKSVLTTTKGKTSAGNKYTSIEIGKTKNDWNYDKYKEKKIKIGKSVINLNNELGRLNIRIDNKKKK